MKTERVRHTTVWTAIRNDRILNFNFKLLPFSPGWRPWALLLLAEKTGVGWLKDAIFFDGRYEVYVVLSVNLQVESLKKKVQTDPGFCEENNPVKIENVARTVSIECTRVS